MKYIQKKAWPIWGMIILTLLLNVIVIASDKNQNWVLIVSIPLFLISIYFAWQTGHLPEKSSLDSSQPSAQHNYFDLLSHSDYPTKIASADLKVQIGNDQCSRPYNACIINVDSMENIDQGSILNNAHQEKELEYSGYSVNKELDTYHLAAGGLVWQIGSEYTGCRAKNGNFNSRAFKAISRQPEVKMIELKLSSAKNTNYPVDSFLKFGEPIDNKTENGIFSNSAFTTFNDAEGMIHFLYSLRELSDGKPIGLRIYINEKKEFYQICHAILKTQIIPDFIVVEGSFENTAIAHSNRVFHTGMPLYEALLFVSQTLQMYRLENKTKIIADGRIISCFDILKVLALGADMICTEMPHYRIIRYPGYGRKVALQFKNQNLYDFHENLVNDTVRIMKVCGFNSIGDITISKFFDCLDLAHSKIIEEPRISVSYSGSVKKIYASKTNTFHMKEEPEKENMA